MDRTQEKIEEIYLIVCVNPKMFTKADVYRDIVKQLNNIVDGGWKYPYISNLHRGEQLDTMSAKIKSAVARLHSQLTQPNRKRYRLEMDCSDEELKEMQKETDLRARALKQLGNLKTEI